MSAEVVGGLFGLGGVVLGFALNTVATSRTRRALSAEAREREKSERELQVAERLDEALVRASRALDGDLAVSVEERYKVAHEHWQDGWVAYSSRLRRPDLLRRYEAVGAILMEVVVGGRSAREIPRHVIARAIANARAALAFFLRGDDGLPRPAFPEREELRSLLADGDISGGDPSGPLKTWLDEHELPVFHPGKA